jgi:hypothetical protein
MRESKKRREPSAGCRVYSSVQETTTVNTAYASYERNDRLERGPAKLRPIGDTA